MKTYDYKEARERLHELYKDEELEMALDSLDNIHLYEQNEAAALWTEEELEILGQPETFGT